MDLGFDVVVELLVDGQRYRALKSQEPNPDAFEENADRLVSEALKKA